MKFSAIALTAATAGVALADSHNHQHRQFHEHKARALVTETEMATATVLELNGSPIAVADACHGVALGEYKWKDPVDARGVCQTTKAASSTAAASTSTSTSAAPTAGNFYQESSSAAAASPSAASWSSGTGVDSVFPDGQLPCNTFPSAYGAIPVSYLGMNGWSGLQAVSIAAGFVNNIVTGISGDNCREGMMCSYACPPGYQKSQWPSTQGATGQSVGGLSCSGGVLHLTNPSLSNKLCIPGVGGVQATNNAGGVVAICRTDYPGTESETIPVELQPGNTQPLTVPDAATYYTWQGKSTSAQYYLNPIGYSASQACQWGSPSQPLGNYAPINFGIGAKDGKTWLSIFQNAPTTNAQYAGTVELTGNLSGTCKYSNGQYCGVTGCNSNGCTVAVISGTATYVISN